MRWFARAVTTTVGVFILLFLVWFWWLPNGGNPRTVNEAVERLLVEFPAEDLEVISAAETSEDLVEFHLSYGMRIRNEFDLWGGNPRLLLSIGRKDALHPDVASHYILVALWEQLRERPREGEPAP